MPQTPARKREYMRGYMRERRRTLHAAGRTCGGICCKNKNVSPFVAKKSLFDTQNVSPPVSPSGGRKVPPFSHYRSRGQGWTKDYTEYLAERGCKTVRTARGWELYDIATGKLRFSPAPDPLREVVFQGSDELAFVDRDTGAVVVVHAQELGRRDGVHP